MVNRGRDAHSNHIHQEDSFSIGLSGYVLWQQGNQPCEQPLVQDRYMLLMNGDVYSTRDNHEDSDTQWLIGRLNQCSSNDDILDLFRGIKGPYSIIFLDKASQQLYFLRDSIGRQTLLLAAQNDGSVVISSVIGKPQADIILNAYDG